MQHDWVPLKRVGLLDFDASIAPFVEDRTLVYDYADDVLGGVNYSYDGDAVSVDVEDGRIVAVMCFEQCLLNDTNLIGLDFDTVEKLLGCPPDGRPDVIEIDDEPELVYDFDEVGAQVWVRNGRVVVITCFGPDPPDDAAT